MTEMIDNEIELAEDAREVLRALMSIALFGECWMKNVIEPIVVERFVEETLPGIDPASLNFELRRFSTVSETRQVKAARYASPYAMVWDVEARKLKDSAGVFQHDHCSPYELRQMMGLPGSIDEEIEIAIRESGYDGDYAGDEIAADEPRLRYITHRTRTIDRREYFGRVPRKTAEDFEVMLSSGSKKQSITPPSLSSDERRKGDDVGSHGGLGQWAHRALRADAAPGSSLLPVLVRRGHRGRGRHRAGGQRARSANPDRRRNPGNRGLQEADGQPDLD